MTDSSQIHQFTLVTRLPDDVDFETLANRLFEAGCDDAVVSSSLGLAFIDYDRESSSSLVDVLSEALEQLGRAGIHVERAEPDDLVTLAEMARRSGYTREALRLWAKGERGDGHFPPPKRGGRDGLTLWSWAEVCAWLVGHVGASEPGTARWRRLESASARAVALLSFNERLARRDGTSRVAPLVAEGRRAGRGGRKT